MISCIFFSNADETKSGCSREEAECVPFLCRFHLVKIFNVKELTIDILPNLSKSINDKKPPKTSRRTILVAHKTDKNFNKPVFEVGDLIFPASEYSQAAFNAESISEGSIFHYECNEINSVCSTSKTISDDNKLRMLDIKKLIEFHVIKILHKCFAHIDTEKYSKVVFENLLIFLSRVVGGHDEITEADLCQILQFDEQQSCFSTMKKYRFSKPIMCFYTSLLREANVSESYLNQEVSYANVIRDYNKKIPHISESSLFTLYLSNYMLEGKFALKSVCSDSLSSSNTFRESIENCFRDDFFKKYLFSRETETALRSSFLNQMYLDSEKNLQYAPCLIDILGPHVKNLLSFLNIPLQSYYDYNGSTTDDEMEYSSNFFGGKSVSSLFHHLKDDNKKLDAIYSLFLVISFGMGSGLMLEETLSQFPCKTLSPWSMRKIDCSILAKVIADARKKYKQKYANIGEVLLNEDSYIFEQYSLARSSLQTKVKEKENINSLFETEYKTGDTTDDTMEEDEF